MFRVGVSSLLIRLSGTSSSSLKSETQIVQCYNNYNIQRTEIFHKNSYKLDMVLIHSTLRFRVCLMTDYKTVSEIR